MSEVGRQVVILAGGLGTRLGKRAADTPKFLLPVAGRPFAHWLLEALAAAGLRQVVLCIGHLGQAIRAELGDGARFGLELDYSEDGPRLLGTAGALRRAARRLAPSFLVTYGDSYLPFDYAAPLRDLEAHPEALGTLAVYRNRDRYDRSNVRITGELVAEYRKSARDAPSDPRFEDIDYGAMALRREAVIALDPDVPASLGQLQAELARRGLLRALRADGCFFEIGSEQGLARLERELSSRVRGSAGRRDPQDTP
jgi:N-acetyl-alpha-D-muramate 1-phosphate uridylyltransferase